mmetsp:Transcript_131346/g.227035  ORF Transcript_131346/g.227035 Transcript_131346/m.227035 type:complete len:87 (-) Transcript_131346:7-267(-)
MRDRAPTSLILASKARLRLRRSSASRLKDAATPRCQSASAVETSAVVRGDGEDDKHLPTPPTSPSSIEAKATYRHMLLETALSLSS